MDKLQFLVLLPIAYTALFHRENVTAENRIKNKTLLNLTKRDITYSQNSASIGCRRRTAQRAASRHRAVDGGGRSV